MGFFSANFAMLCSLSWLSCRKRWAESEAGLISTPKQISSNLKWGIAVYLSVACDVYDVVLFPTRYRGKILNLIEPVSEDFPTYSF